MGNITAIVAGCGGAGKTTAAINLGVAMAHQGRRVLLVDAAAGLPDLDASLGIERLVRHTVADVARGRCAAVDAVVPVPGLDRLSVLAAGTSDSDSAGAASLAAICRNLLEHFDHILIDAPPGNERGLLAAAAAADAVVIVAQHTAQQRRGVEAMLSLLREHRLLAGHPFLLFNRTTPQRTAAAGVRAVDLLYGWGLEEDDVTGAIPEDEVAISAKHNGVPLLAAAPGSAAAQAYAVAAKALLARLDNIATDEDDDAEEEDDVSRSQA